MTDQRGKGGPRVTRATRTAGVELGQRLRITSLFGLRTIFPQRPGSKYSASKRVRLRNFFPKGFAIEGAVAGRATRRIRLGWRDG